MISLRLFHCKVKTTKTKVRVLVTDVKTGEHLTFDVPPPFLDETEVNRFYIMNNTRFFLKGRGHDVIGCQGAVDKKPMEFFMVAYFAPKPL
jgi:hypothetical protein